MKKPKNIFKIVFPRKHFMRNQAFLKTVHIETKNILCCLYIAWVIQNNQTLQCTCITNKISFRFLYFYFQNNHCKKKTTSIILYPYYTNIDAVNTKVKMTKKKIITVTAICVHVVIKVHVGESYWRNWHTPPKLPMYIHV